MKHELKLPWPVFHGLCIDLADRIEEVYRSRGPFPEVELVGVLRGGVVVAVAVSHELERRGIATTVRPIGVRRYQGRAPGETEVYCRPGLLSSEALVVLVDEKADEGVTLRCARNVLMEGTPRELLSAALFTTALDLTDLYVCLGDPEEWVVFPWEMGLK